MLALAATFVGFSAFKLVDDPESGWYALTITSGEDGSLPEHQEINPNRLNEEPEGDCDRLNRKDVVCAIQLTFSEDATTMPTTVQDAIDDPEVTPGSYTWSEEDPE